MSVKILQAKKAFLDKLSKALDKEQEISDALGRTEYDSKEQHITTANIQVEFGDYMDKFIMRVKDKNKHQENIHKLKKLIDTTRLELANISTATPPKKTRPKKSIHIKFKDGAIRPTHQVFSKNFSLYHWELNSDAQSWTSIGNDTEIELGQSSGEVRLHCNGDQYISNKIKISTVIKRQAAAAKRKQYRFELDDIEFQQRCTGVAGRIKRLLSPPVRNITNASFNMRVFQDRVAKLPEYLNVDLPTIVDLCDNNDVTDPDYIAMVEFIEPTIHLNPKKLHSELKDIYEGNRVILKIDQREEKKKPAQPSLFMLDEASTKEEEGEGETKRQVVRRTRAQKKEERLRIEQEILEQKQRSQELMYALEQEENLRKEKAEIALKKQKDDERIKRERKQQADEAEEATEKLRQEEEEIARKKQEDDERIERERRQQEVEAEKAAEKLRKEQAEITRKKQEDDERIERERQQQEVEAEKAADKLRQEQEEIERKQIEDNERIQQERDVISRQRETVDELQTNVTIMSEYKKATGKGSGQELSGGNEWFIVNGKNGNQSVYKTTKTNKSSPKKSTMEKANAAGWYSKDFMTGRESKLLEEKEELRKKEVEIAQKAKEEQERIESERQQQADEAEQAAEKLRQEEAEIALKKQKDDERIERERKQQADEAEQAAEKLRQEEAEITRKKQEDDDRIERERRQQEVEAEKAAEKLRKEQAEITRKKQEDDDRIERERQQPAIKQVNQLSQSDRNYIKYVFDWYDKEPKDGRIELTELEDALSAAGYDASAAEQMLNEYDKDGNGNLDYDEFEMWCAVTNAVESWKKSDADFNQTNWRVEDLSNIKNYTHVRLNGTPGTLKKSKNKFSFKADTAGSAYKFIRAPRQQTFEVEVENTSSEEESSEEEEVKRDTEEEVKRETEEEVKRDAEEDDELSTMNISDLKKRAVVLNKKKKGTVTGYSKLRQGDEKELADLIRTAESKMSIVPPGELSEMLNNMTDDWASSDEELNFAMDSENEDMEFAASSAVDTDDSDLDFAESSDKKTSSGLEFAESSHTSSGLEFAASSAVDSDKSEDFAVSSAVETDSDLDFAESSGKTSSGLDFAESSTVESD